MRCLIFLVLLLTLIGCKKNDRIEVNVLTEYGYGKLKDVLPEKALQVSFLNKYGTITNGDKFVHPGWLKEKNKHSIVGVDEMLKLVRTYSPHSIDILFWGTHGHPGIAQMSDNKNILDIDSRALMIIRSHMAYDGWFIMTGCNVARDVGSVHSFAKRLKRPVVVANSSTDNDPDVSLWGKGEWLIFWP